MLALGANRDSREWSRLLCISKTYKFVRYVTNDGEGVRTHSERNNVPFSGSMQKVRYEDAATAPPRLSWKPPIDTYPCRDLAHDHGTHLRRLSTHHVHGILQSKMMGQEYILERSRQRSTYHLALHHVRRGIHRARRHGRYGTHHDHAHLHGILHGHHPGL
ncbi:unnamed protein product [Somion occarium]|uniref:Uncharacterized protein n=1 Tax=Somion occarium TaxID=3059160 RepID=A0ABP1DK36_9APHY